MGRVELVTIKVQFAVACGNNIPKPHAVFLFEDQHDLSESVASLKESRLPPYFDGLVCQNRSAPRSFIQAVPDQVEARPGN